MSVRLRRLKADYEKLCTLFTQKSRIRIKKTLGDPPDRYQLEYLVTGLEKKLNGELQARNNFLVEITLTGAYPRLAPQCRMLTPVYHPNIAPHAVCIGDHWAAGEPLPNLVVRIAEMISYQSYNVKSPLNGDAAEWVERNKDKLPLDTFDFTSLLSIGEATGRSPDGGSIAGARCANCGIPTDQAELKVCANNHVACSNCMLECASCHASICLKCMLVTCTICKQTVCQRCSFRCGSCTHLVCARHHDRCGVCGNGRCHECLVDCHTCGGHACMEHIHKVKADDGVTKYTCTHCVPGA
ncbi:MAG TPA: ubiquitin-conjugating enzyme E2 [Planctomycetota bacterium]|jgi:ubiquitin-protein ligase